MRVAFGSLKVDQPDLIHGELEQALNCIPYVQSYGPFPSPEPYSDSVGATCYGAYSTKDTSGNVYTFIGTEKYLYKESATAINDVSRTATYAAANDGALWEFETFGNTVIAANAESPLQIYTLGTSTQFLNASASASAPTARHLAVVRDFVVTGHQPTLETRVQWSRINNPLRYTPSQRYQSDYQDLPGTDQIIKKVTGGDFGAILTNTSVWRMSYVGSPLIFRFDEVARNVGCLASGSVARFQSLSFYLATSGFQMFDGTQCLPIGRDRVDETLMADLNKTYLNRISATIDPVNSLYLMAYPSVASTDGTCDKIIVYSWITQRWTFVQETTQVLFNHMTGGYTLEGLDAFGTLETLAFSLDSSVWQGGLSAMSCINGFGQISRFEGDPKTATFITGESQIFPNSRSYARSVRPLVQGTSTTTITACIGGRDRLIDDVTWGATSPMNAIGECPVRANNRYQRLRLDVANGFERVMGADIDVVKDGVR